MSKLPEAQDVRNLLEGYGITDEFVTDQWIENRRDRFVVPWVERKIRKSVSAAEQVEEYLSGTGYTTLPLSRRNIVSLDEIRYVTGGDAANIQLNSIELIKDEGMLKSKRRTEATTTQPLTFAKGKYNIFVKYTVGLDNTDYDDISEAIAALTACSMLDFVSGRTGGGDLSVQAYSRSYGDRGKYTHVRNDLARMGIALLKSEMTGVVAQ